MKYEKIVLTDSCFGKTPKIKKHSLVNLLFFSATPSHEHFFQAIIGPSSQSMRIAIRIL
jgi:hypothetical protein